MVWISIDTITLVYGFKVINALPNDIILATSEVKAFAYGTIKDLSKYCTWLLLGRKRGVKKEKMLVTSISSFFPNVFKRLFSPGPSSDVIILYRVKYTNEDL